MPVKGTGPLGIETDIVAEFGGAAPHALGEYYRGTLVPNGPPQNAAIPTSGAISIGNFYGGVAAFVFNLAIGSAQNFNLRSHMIANGWDGVTPAIGTLTINSGAYVYASSTGVYAFDTGAYFPSGSNIEIVNNGVIIGRGGNGGAGAQTPGGGDVLGNNRSGGGYGGGAGGPAFYARGPIKLRNNGHIGGGGGGGGGGGDVYFSNGGTWVRMGGSGGGGGRGIASGGAAGYNFYDDGNSGAYGNPNPGPGYDGSLSAGGGSPQPAVYAPAWPIYAAAGGVGGGIGSSGSTGAAGSVSSPYYNYSSGGGGGGPPGNAIVGNGYITWLAFGSRYGGIA